MLRHIYKSNYEVPVVAMFCKENCGELLAVRESDAPAPCTGQDALEWEKQGIFVAAGAVLAYGRKIRRWDVLWSVYNASFRWGALQMQKESKRRLLENVVRSPTGIWAKGVQQ